MRAAPLRNAGLHKRRQQIAKPSRDALADGNLLPALGRQQVAALRHVLAKDTREFGSGMGVGNEQVALVVER